MISVDELTSISDEKGIGIIEWELTDESPGQYKICRFFQGIGWSAIANLGLNCINGTIEGMTFDEIVDWMFENDQLFEDEEQVESSLNLEYDFEEE